MVLPEGVSLRLLILPWVGRAIQIPSHPLRLHIALELAMGWAEPSAGRLVFLPRFDRVVGFEPVTSHMRGERPNHSATSVPCPLAGCPITLEPPLPERPRTGLAQEPCKQPRLCLPAVQGRRQAGPCRAADQTGCRPRHALFVPLAKTGPLAQSHCNRRCLRGHVQVLEMHGSANTRSE